MAEVCEDNVTDVVTNVVLFAGGGPHRGDAGVYTIVHHDGWWAIECYVVYGVAVV